MRIVFDTNVLVAAFAAEGLCARLLQRANRGHFELYICPFIFQEFENTLRKKLSLSPRDLENASTLLAEASRIIEPEEKGIEVSGVCRDKKDDSIIACALACRADYIVTGDKDVLELKRYKSVKIVSPREFELMTYKT